MEIICYILFWLFVYGCYCFMSFFIIIGLVSGTISDNNVIRKISEILIKFFEITAFPIVLLSKMK